MRILVTGNLGYIGPVLSATLTAAGHAVHGFDSALFVRHATHPLPPIAHQTIADLRDGAALARALASCDAVVHLAAMSNDPLGELEPALTRSVNLDATLDVIRLAEDRPLVLYSSASVYGIGGTARSEAAAVRPLTLYSELKAAAEQRAFAGPRALVLRNGTVHGPAPVLRGDLLLNAMVASAVTSGEVVLMTTPSTRRPVIDVRDLASLTLGLLERGTTGLFNVASANVTVGEAAALVAGITHAAIRERYDSADPRDYAMDTAKLDGVASPWWSPRPLGASVEDLVAHFREIGLTAADVASRRYHRIVQYVSRPVAGVAAG